MIWESSAGVGRKREGSAIMDRLAGRWLTDGPTDGCNPTLFAASLFLLEKPKWVIIAEKEMRVAEHS